MYASDLPRILQLAEDRSRVERGLNIHDWLVYGAGRTGRRWAVALARDGRQVHGFIDRGVVASEPLPVFSPGECPAVLRRQCAVLLAVHNPAVDIAAVRQALTTGGYQNIWLLQDLIDAWPQLASFWLAHSRESLPYADDIHAVYEALADDQSRAIYVSLIDQRLNGTIENPPTANFERHYFPLDLPPPPNPLRFVDCGAYIGDTVDALRRAGFGFDQLAAFEPDPTHYPRLCASIGLERAHLFPCGVWDHMTQLRFVSDAAASHIADHGDTTVQTLSLDQALPNFAPNYIKMDIEGAESKALLGARGLISRYRPRLAISSYHKPRDLWELLLLVSRWDLGYQFHLRSHAFNGFDTVLYGLPT